MPRFRFPRMTKESSITVALASWLAILTVAGGVGWMMLKVQPAPAPLPVPPVPANISLPAEVKGGVGELIDVQAETAGAVVQWHASAGLSWRELCPSSGSKQCVLAAPRPGRYTLLAWTSIDGKPTKAATCIVVIGTAPPGPVPEPGPQPPTPPAPIPAGFRVLMVNESSAKMTKEEVAIWDSTAIITYLNQKCTKDGGRPAWRKWDRDIDPAKDLEVWQKLWAATKPQLTKLPAIVIVNDLKGEVFQFPDTEAAMLDLLKKYGG